MSSSAAIMASPILAPGLEYAEQVAAGVVLAGSLAAAACRRFLAGLATAPTEAGIDGDAETVFEFDVLAAESVVDAAYLFKHVKGPKTGHRLELEPWQIFAVADLVGWVDGDGARRYRQAFWGIPRGNGKTAIAAYLALVLGFLEGEGGAESFSAAVTRDQAKICFSMGRLMMQRASATIKDEFGIQVRTHDIVADDGASFFRPLSSDADSLDGLSVHFAAVDEIASHKTSAVYDALITGCGKRTQPLLLAITTATSNLSGIGRNLWNYATRILQGAEQNERFHALIYAADEVDDYWAESTWRKVNPNWGVSVFPVAIRSLAKQARRNAAQEAAFFTRHLNVWLGAEGALFNSTAWAACAQPGLRAENYRGEAAWLGVDLSSTTDLTALVACIPQSDHTVFLARLYIPRAAALEQRVAEYPQWLEAGHLTLCGEDTIDQSQIQDDIVELCELLDVRGLAFDPWQAQKLVKDLAEDVPDLEAVEFRQTVKNYSEPTKKFTGEIQARRIRHDGNAALAWCIGNVVGHYDTADNVRPKRANPKMKIDGAAASIMAYACSLFGDEAVETTVHSV